MPEFFPRTSRFPDYQRVKTTLVRGVERHRQLIMVGGLDQIIRSKLERLDLLTTSLPEPNTILSAVDLFNKVAEMRQLAHEILLTRGMDANEGFSNICLLTARMHQVLQEL